MRIFLRLRRAFLLAVMFWSGSVWADAGGSERVYQVDVPSGSLQATLLALANELKVSVFFAKETVAGYTAQSVRGEFTLEALFTELLADTCIKHEFVREQLVALSPGCPSIPEVAVQPAAVVAEQAPTAESPIEEILVSERHITGTRIRTASFGNNMPLDIIDQTEIRLSGYQAVGEMLRYVPAVSGNSASTLVSNGGDGSATVTLRGLPASNTLILLNGRRMNSDALQGSSVDLNTLPLAMVEQVEIVKDGVSAIYGSDAVAGVVNIITKKDVDGLVVEAYTGESSEGDLRTQNLTLMFGTQGARWRAMVGYNFYDQKGISSRNRDLSSTSDDRSRGGIDKRSSATAPARVGLAGGPAILIDGASGTLPGDFRPATPEDRFEYRDYTTSIVPSERSSLFANIDWAIGEYWEGYAEGLWTKTEAQAFLAPVPLFTAFEPRPITVDADQAFNPFGEALIDVRRRLVELSSREQYNETTTLRGVVGLRLQTDSSNLDLALQYNETDSTEKLLNGANATYVNRALSGNCVSPCVPLNLFGPRGSITQDMQDYIGINARVEGTSKLYAFTLDTDWQFGSVEMASGLEYRRDELATSPDRALRTNSLIAGGNRSAISGSRDIFEVYAEALLPIASGRPWVERMDLQVAARYSHYSDFGNQINPRILFSWVPVEGLTFRTSIARGFRAPTLLQLRASQQQSFEQLNDPCSVAANVGVLQGCSLQSDPSLTQILTSTGGDGSLDPEISRTLSVGFLWQDKVAGMDVILSTDWYDIDQEDVVDTSAQFILDQNARYGAFANRISRNMNGNVESIRATYQNIGKRQVKGVDITATLTRDMAQLGRFTFAFNATHIAEFQDKFDPTSPTVDKAGTFRDEASGGLGALPDWKLNAGFSWQHKNWQAHYNIYRVSELDEIVPLEERKRTIDSWTTHNANMSYLGPMSAWIRITLGMNNIFDESPPFSAAAFNDSYDGRTYDITGRYYFLKLDRSF